MTILVFFKASFVLSSVNHIRPDDNRKGKLWDVNVECVYLSSNNSFVFVFSTENE